jgi:hypothetical protein
MGGLATVTVDVAGRNDSCKLPLFNCK